MVSSPFSYGNEVIVVMYWNAIHSQLWYCYALEHVDTTCIWYQKISWELISKFLIFRIQLNPRR